VKVFHGLNRLLKIKKAVEILEVLHGLDFNIKRSAADKPP
jgi:hypothetical protein